MKILFSKRHAKAIREKTFPLKFSYPIRVSILRILEQHSFWAGYDNSENFTFEAIEELLKTFYGKEYLESFDDNDKRVPSTVSGTLLKGYPSEVADIIEAYFVCCEANDGPKCEKELNDILSMNGSPWRFVNGDAILVDSEYIHEEIQARTVYLLKQGSAFGALQEFQDAIQDLLAGSTKDSIVKAHKSVESVMKCALDTQEHKTFGHLLSSLIKSGVIPEYYEEFLKHFEKLALGAVKERNLPARGHGQGSEVVDVPRSLAEFAVNLAATVNRFIIERWLETKKIPEEVNDDYIPEISDDDIPL